MMARGCADLAVARDKRGVQKLSQRHVNRIIGGEIVTELPDPGQKQAVRIPGNSRVYQVSYG